MNLLQQHLFMVETNAVRRHVEVIQADLTDQRLLPFIFTPRANDFHMTLTEQS